MTAKLQAKHERSIHHRTVMKEQITYAILIMDPQATHIKHYTHITFVTSHSVALQTLAYLK